MIFIRDSSSENDPAGGGTFFSVTISSGRLASDAPNCAGQNK